MLFQRGERSGRIEHHLNRRDPQMDAFLLMSYTFWKIQAMPLCHLNPPPHPFISWHRMGQDHSRKASD